MNSCKIKVYIIDHLAIIIFVKGIDAKSCADRLKELQSSPPLLGAFKPKCQPNGLYEETQCHGNYYF